MTKFIAYWELDMNRMPDNPKERITNWTTLLNMVKNDLESRKMADWGNFSGEHRGYVIIEGTEQNVDMTLKKYYPYVQFNVHSIIPVSQVIDTIKALPQA